MSERDRRRGGGGKRSRGSKSTPRKRNRSSRGASSAAGSRGTGTSKRSAASTGGRRAAVPRGRSSAKSRKASRRPKQPTKSRTKRTRRRRALLKWGAITSAILLAALLIVGGLGYVAIARELPEPGEQPAGRDQTSVIYDRDGEVLAQLFAEENRTDRALEDMPVALRQGVIATEDQRYYDHSGVDPWGILRALWVDVTQGKRHGGSTITQQYVKNALVTPEFTLKRKLKEALLAYRVESELSKDEILELYLNTIYFGHGAYGVEAASKAYFGKPVDQLTLAESAMLAGVIRSPGDYSPYLEPEAAHERRDIVLGLMLDQGYVTQEEHDATVAQEVVAAGLPESSSAAPYFVEYVKAQLTEEYGSDQVWRGGISVKTTLDMEMQRAAEEAVADVLDEADDPSASLVAIDPVTGEILAMVGGRDFATQQFNVAAQGKRQPGSSFKPFVFATALAEGVSANKSYNAAATQLALENGQTWKVTGKKGGGTMALRPAMEQSVNSVWAQLIMDVGPEKVVETVEALGIHEGVSAVPAIALGGLEEGVSPLEMASAYGVFANEGRHAEPVGITEVIDANGDTIHTAEPEITEAIEPAIAYLTADVLKGVISRGTGKAAAIGRPAAGKTGTTQEYRDAWFVGFTPQVSAAVWVGYPEEQREMKDVHGRRVTGGSFPAEIWAAFMKRAHEGLEELDFVEPDGIVAAKCCTTTGLRVTEYCPESYTGVFIEGHLPGECTTHTTPETIEIPDLVGMTKEKALGLLKDLMLLFEVVEQEVDGVPAGIVAQQTPAPGSTGTTQTVVKIIVSDGGGTDLPPEARLAFTPVNAATGQVVTFSAAASSDDNEIAGYLWEFGDGGQADGVEVTHAYLNPGTYEITLWVTDTAGQTSSVTAEIVAQ